MVSFPYHSYSEAGCMGILLFFLIVILIATFGFWDTLAALLGAALMVVLAVGIGIAVVVVGGLMFLKKGR